MITKRKYPVIAEQEWANTLFLHWKVHPHDMQSVLPKPLLIDTFQGDAWISIVIFEARNSRPIFIPKQFSVKPVTQINVRTYVKHPNSYERGVYFFKLYVQHPLAVLGAKFIYHLPFQYITTSMDSDKNRFFVNGKDKSQSIFTAQFKPTGKRADTELAQFLTERYCIWTKKGTRTIKIPIYHSLWDLQTAEVHIEKNDLLRVKTSTTHPIAHYNSYKIAKLFPYEHI